jgi:hypothetical protein
MIAEDTSLDQTPERPDAVPSRTWLVGLAAATVVLAAICIALEVVINVASPTGNGTGPSNIVGGLGVLSPSLAFTFVGFVIVSRRSTNPIGWMMCALGSAYIVSILLGDTAHYLYSGRHDHGPGVFGLQIVGQILFPVFLLCLGALLNIFPTGRPAGPRRALVLRWGTWLTVVFIALAIFSPGRMQNIPANNPIALPFVPEIFGAFAFFIPLAIILMGVASLVRRFWVARGTERQQLKWFMYGAVIAVVLFFGALASSFWWLMAGMSLIPIATGVAILQYRLWDIDVLINRTIVYGALTASLGALYAGGVLGIQAMLGSATGQSSAVAVAVSTLAIAALFAPLRRRIQVGIDRRFFRRRYDATQALTGLSLKLRDEIDLDRLRAEVLAVVHEVIQPADASLWLRESAEPPSERRSAL